MNRHIPINDKQIIDNIISNIIKTRKQKKLSQAKLSELCEKVAGLGVGDVTIYGTKLALSKIPGIEALEVDGLDRRNNGYLKVFEGYNCVDLKNTFNKKSF